MNLNTGGRLTGRQEAQIKIIGDKVMASRTGSTEKPFTAGIIVDTKEIADRYEKRIRELYPEIRILKSLPSGIRGTWLLQIGAPAG